MKIDSLLILLSLSTLLVFKAQGQNIDSLLKLMSQSKGIEKAKLLCEISEVCDDEDIYKYAKETYQHSKSINYSEGMSCGLNNMGFALNNEERSDSARYYYEQALWIRKNKKESNDKISETLNNLSAWFIERGNYNRALGYLGESLALITDTLTLSFANSLSQQATIHSFQGNYKKSIELYDRSLVIFRKLPDKQNILLTLNNLAVSNTELGRLDTSMKLLDECIKINRGEKKYAAEMANSLNNLSLVYLNIGDIIKSLKYNDSSIRYCERADLKKELATNYNTRAAIFESQQDFEKALLFYKKALSLRKEIEYFPGVAITEINIGSTYLRLAHPDSAYLFFTKGYEAASSVNDSRGMANALINMGHFFWQKKVPDSAIAYYQRSVSLFNQIEDSRGLSYAFYSLARVHLDNNEVIKANYNSKLGFDHANATGQPQLIMQSSGQLAKIYSILGNYEKAYDLQNIYIRYKDSIRNDETKAALIKNQMRYEFSFKENQLRTDAENERIKINAKLERQKFIFYSWAGFAALFLIIFILLFQFYRKKKEYQHAQASFKALNAQFKDHYFTNLLTSLQFYLLVHPDKGKTYAELMSKYFQTVLDYSYETSISLEKEFDLAENYLLLNKNDKDFEYIFEQTGVDAQRFQVPPLILQPILENAIKHGMTRISHSGLIKINATMNGKMLVLCITDNGAGLKINDVEEEGHVSHGNEITKERLRIFGKLKGKKTNYKISDNGSGVSVTISIKV